MLSCEILYLVILKPCSQWLLGCTGVHTINEKKFNIFANGPAMIEVNRLSGEVRTMKTNTFDDKVYLKRDLTDKELDYFGMR